jgi:hypothetical protein
MASTLSITSISPSIALFIADLDPVAPGSTVSFIQSGATGNDKDLSALSMPGPLKAYLSRLDNWAEVGGLVPGGKLRWRYAAGGGQTQKMALSQPVAVTSQGAIITQNAQTGVGFQSTLPPTSQNVILVVELCFIHSMCR